MKNVQKRIEFATIIFFTVFLAGEKSRLLNKDFFLVIQDSGIKEINPYLEQHLGRQVSRPAIYFSQDKINMGNDKQNIPLKTFC